MSNIRMLAFGAAVLMAVLFCCVIVAGWIRAEPVHVATAADAKGANAVEIARNALRTPYPAAQHSS
jgi:hypothetical protein